MTPQCCNGRALHRPPSGGTTIHLPARHATWSPIGKRVLSGSGLPHYSVVLILLCMPRTQRGQPVQVAEAKRRRPDSKGRAVGFRGYIVHRSAEHIAWLGGEWAAFALVAIDEVVTGLPVRFATFASRREALAHARKAVQRARRVQRVPASR